MIRHTLFNRFFMPALLLCSAAASAQQWNGLTLYSNKGSTTASLIDTNSTVVKTWNLTGGTGYSTYMTPGGDLWRSVSAQTSLNGGGMTGRIQKVSYAGTILWDYTYSSSTYCLHHDHYPMPNGNVLVISYEVKTAADATAAGCSSAMVIWSEKIMELEPVGTSGANVVWEWHAWDHLVQNVNASAANYQISVVDNPQLLNINYGTQKEWLHMNGIDYNPMLDQIVMSSHMLNEWYVIDHSTTSAEAASHTGGNSGKGGDILYRWGNTPAYSAGGTKVLNVTHEAHWVPEGSPNAGDLVGVNNGGSSGPKTTIDGVTPPRVDYNYTLTPGSAYSPASYGSRYVTSGYTSDMGSSQQLPNGNQLICLATAGVFYEIDANGTTLWTKTTNGTTPVAERYSDCYINNPAPAQPSITATGSVLSTASTASYQWYQNGNLITGATSQTYTASQAGIYVVRTTDVNGCVNVYSPGFTFTVGTTPPPEPTGISANSFSSKVSVYPNPTNGLVDVNFNGISMDNVSMSVYDLTGKLVLTEKNKTQIDLSSLKSGLYILNIGSSNNLPIIKKITLLNN